MLAQSCCSSKTLSFKSLSSNVIILDMSPSLQGGNSFSAHFVPDSVYLYIYIYIFVVTIYSHTWTTCWDPMSLVPAATLSLSLCLFLSLSPKSIRFVSRVKGDSTGRFDWMNRIIDPAEHRRDWMRDTFNLWSWLDDWEAVCLVRHKTFVVSSTKREPKAESIKVHAWILTCDWSPLLVTVKNDRYLQQKSMFWACDSIYSTSYIKHNMCVRVRVCVCVWERVRISDKDT